MNVAEDSVLLINMSRYKMPTGYESYGSVVKQNEDSVALKVYHNNVHREPMIFIVPKVFCSRA